MDQKGDFALTAFLDLSGTSDTVDKLVWSTVCRARSASVGPCLNGWFISYLTGRTEHVLFRGVTVKSPARSAEYGSLHSAGFRIIGTALLFVLSRRDVETFLCGRLPDVHFQQVIWCHDRRESTSKVLRWYDSVDEIQPFKPQPIKDTVYAMCLTLSGSAD